MPCQLLSAAGQIGRSWQLRPPGLQCYRYCPNRHASLLDILHSSIRRYGNGSNIIRCELVCCGRISHIDDHPCPREKVEDAAKEERHDRTCSDVSRPSAMPAVRAYKS